MQVSRRISARVGATRLRWNRIGKTETSALIPPLDIMKFIEISNFDFIRLKFYGLVVDIVNIQNKNRAFFNMRTLNINHIIKKEKVIDNGDFPI